VDGTPIELKEHFNKYQKKPIVEAFRIRITLLIHTLEGIMVAQSGDFVIKGVDGEVYPCKPEILKKHITLWSD
jgi:hypothetical protein